MKISDRHIGAMPKGRAVCAPLVVSKMLVLKMFSLFTHTTFVPKLRAMMLVALMGAMVCFTTIPGAAYAQGGDAAEQALDYAAWDKAALEAEAALQAEATDQVELENLRSGLADWRARLDAAQSANSARIATVREQIAALGAPPAEGAAEAPEIASRRGELADQLAVLEAPGIAAEEAYRRADGLIREIDKTLRGAQADQLLELLPSPLNPVHWDDAALALSDTVARIWSEGKQGWSDARERAAFMENLPVILGLLAIAVAAIVFARRWLSALSDRLLARGSAARKQAVALLISFAQVIVPTIGVMAFCAAVVLTGLPGELSDQILRALPIIGFTVFASGWLGARLFPRHEEADSILQLPPEARSEGRMHALLMGAVLGAEHLRQVAMGPQNYSDAVTSVVSFPLILAGGVLLWRIGVLLRRAFAETESQSFTRTILSLLSRLYVALGVLGPALAAFGYVPAAQGLIYPGIMTLGLMGFLLMIQRVLAGLWDALSQRAGVGDDQKGLVPVLIGFVLTLLALPLLALIWGARLADLSELWTRFSAGFQLGETRISPTDFLVFLLIFGAGYSATKLFQGALKNTILPRTRMEQGAQNALVSGTGYIGVFLAALVAINATGIDLSGLAIVASALSVGIGFGLQNIVQNFVSGIILMIERPVSEGDWIAVGQTQGIVKSISVRSTRVQTFDRNVIVVPNADLVSQPVTNWTRFNLTGRVIVPVGVAYGSDTRHVERVLREIAEADPLVILNPPPAVLFTGFGADSLDFEVRVVLRDVNFSSTVRSEMNHAIVKRFAEEGIDIPFAHRDISLRNPEDLARAFGGVSQVKVEPVALPQETQPDGGLRPGPLADKTS